MLLPVGCKPGADDSGSPPAEGVLAIVDPARAEHFFDLPWPTDDALRDGRASLQGYPLVQEGPLAPVLAGWAARIEQTTRGFANDGAAYFRFEAALDGLPATTAGLPTDPVLWACDAPDGVELLPLDLRFVDDPLGDPAWAPNTLAFGPILGRPPASGATCAAVVMAAAGVRAPDGYSLPEGVQARLDAAGVVGEAAVATLFTVQDGTAELRALAADVDARLGAATDGSGVSFRRVTSLAYHQGLTPSGKDATLATATFEDGSTEVAYLAPLEEGGEHTTLLDESWPMVVYQASIPTLNYSGLEDRPYMSPGLAHLADVDRSTGWIGFDAAGAVERAPETEWMRIVVSLPRGKDGQPAHDAPVVIWDHGTGGHAYNSVQRRNQADDGRALAQALADAGYAIIGRDAALYGTRYPLVDEGYDASLGFYNIVNLPAFRDNQRQTAVDGHVLLRFVQRDLDAALPAGSVDETRLRRAGHSLGSVTANLGLAMDPEAFDAAFLSGSGGLFSHYFLDTGLIDTIDPTTMAALFALLGVDDPPDPVTAPAALGAAMGLPEEAWARIDRLHPALQLFQWTMDPSDPMAVARDEALPTTMIIGAGDWQVPDFTSEALCDLALPDCTRTTVEADGDYDPHYVMHRTEEGLALWQSWLADQD
ncbi:hypothetical protein L6R53_04185 [Myxococcota bacterium]|nr:hypothetical protein [Myxococcota bacterium]